MKTIPLLAALAFAMLGALPAIAQQTPDEQTKQLADELKTKGWLVYGARAQGGSWDLFLSRPDGSEKRNITNTTDYEEAAPRFSPDGTRLLYRRLAKDTAINHDQWGFQGELILANADGSNPQALGAEGEFPWATWSPDGKQLVCLLKKGIQVVDLNTRQAVKTLPRQGIYQQLFCSPDGKWFCGVANIQGESWTVVRVNAETGELNPVRSFQNCTPDWFSDSVRIIMSSRPDNQPGANGYGYTQLWVANGDGSNQQLLYGEDGAHIYGGAVSPDGQYVLFTKGPKDGSGSDKAGAPMGIVRLADTPIITGESPDLRKLHPNTKNGPVLMLDTAWEPHWTYAEIGGK